MTCNSGWALGVSVAALLALATTNPDSVRLKEQLLALLRDRLDTMGESGGEGVRLLGVSLELADKKALARDGLCVVGIAGTFFPCNTHASEWLAAPAEAQ